MAARNSERTNTPTEQNKEDNSLILYRLTAVERLQRELNEKFDKQDNIKKSDLVEFRDTIIERVNDVKASLQKQIDDLETEKADQKDVDDIRTLIKGVAAVFTSVITALVIYYLTTGKSK